MNSLITNSFSTTIDNSPIKLATTLLTIGVSSPQSSENFYLSFSLCCCPDLVYTGINIFTAATR